MRSPSALLSLSLPPGLALDQDKLQKMRKRATRVSTLNNCRALAVTATVSLFSHMRLIVREGALGKVAVRERKRGRVGEGGDALAVCLCELLRPIVQLPAIACEIALKCELH